MGRFVISYFNMAPSATWTASSSAAGYSPQWVADRRADRGHRLVGASQWLLATFAVPTRVDVIGVIGHTGSSILIEAGNSAPGAGSPLRFNIGPGASTYDGYLPSPWGFTTGRAGYTTAGYSQWKFTFGGTNVHVCEIFFGTLYNEFTIGPQWGAQRTYKRLAVQHQTELGVPLTYDRGATVRSFRGRFLTKDASQAELIMTWWRSGKAGVEPALVIPNTDDVDDAWLATFSGNEHTWRSVKGTVREHELTFRDLPRGVVL